MGRKRKREASRSPVGPNTIRMDEDGGRMRVVYSGCPRTPRCDLWLAGEADEEPDRVCWGAGGHSLQTYAEQYADLLCVPAQREEFASVAGASGLAVWFPLRY